MYQAAFFIGDCVSRFRFFVLPTPKSGENVEFGMLILHLLLAWPVLLSFLYTPAASNTCG